MQFLDFSLAQKSAKRFFLQYVKTRSVYDCTKITNCWLKGFMNLLFFCLIILKFSVYEIPSSFRTSSFADEKKPLQCLNSVFAFSVRTILASPQRREIKKMQKRRKASRRRTIVRQRRFSAVEKADNLFFGEIR